MIRWAFFATALVLAIAVDIAVMRVIADALGLSSDWRSFLASFGGVLIGMYGLRMFSRIWPKVRERGSR